MMLARLFHWLGLPGFVRDFRDYHNGSLLEIKLSPFYTKITVNDKEYLFNRESGKYDGWGQSQEVTTEAESTKDNEVTK